MKPVHVAAVGVAAPGLSSWAGTIPVLDGTTTYAPAALPSYAPQLLPPNERRRATPAVRLAFQAAEDAISAGAMPAGDTATIFATSDADTTIIDRICSALAQPNRVVSPTDFHNSVHNAAAGYWSIASGGRRGSTSLSAGDDTFAIGLLEAAALVHVEGHPVLFVAYDIVPPPPLDAARGIGAPFAVALVLAREAAGSGTTPRLVLDLRTDAALRETTLDDAALEQLRNANPAARALPLLRHLARRDTGRVVVGLAGDARLCIGVEPA
ncbi:MAG TPA: beta-ketoacyl synthase chain length factor [Nevskiaceae bacterium]|nr:beta-ketoacyl synthase chain length factor [Nevskiaceae bacterium]